ncbi:hypothetical protein [Actinomadura sp. NTSP31]|uniref:hypothetical protein n=1 Tax=Actinomadura sp. NTSP31 TaxID=1735447 RepID=UPI0035C0A45E
MLGCLAVGPGLAPGYVLSYDMVFVPHPAANDAMFGLAGGFPRQVPSDAVVAGLAAVLPADLVQKLVLLAVFAVAGAGAARLVRERGTVVRIAAAVAYVWNPYVAERLLLGHWALLLGYAGLPWVLHASTGVTARRGFAGLVRALVPAAVGGFAAWDVSALVAAGGAVAVAGHSRRHRARAALLTALALAGVALPWLVPALLSSGRASSDPAGVDLFAARADTPFGAFGSLLSLGGIWNAEVVPAGFGSLPTAGGRLVLSVLAIIGFGVLLRRSADPRLRGLAVSAAAGFVIACAGITGPGRAALRGLVGLWPGFGVLRDAQVYIAPLALLEAVGLAFLVAELLRRAYPALAALLAVAPVALLPTLAWGAAGNLRAVHYPADWAAARAIINADPAPGRVLDLPWGGYRRYAWNHGRTVLDPLPRVLDRQVVWDDGLRVGNRALAAEAPAARRAQALLRGRGALAPALAGSGYRYVVLERVGDPEENALAGRLGGARIVLSGRHLTVFQLGSSAPPPGPASTDVAPVAGADILTLLLILWSMSIYATSLGGTPRVPASREPPACAS